MKRVLLFMITTLSIIMLSMSSCVYHDRVAGATIVFKNDSNHYIFLRNIDDPISPKEHDSGIELYPGDEVLYHAHSHETGMRGELEADHFIIADNAKNLLPRGFYAIFDDQYIVTYSRGMDSNNNPCQLESYIPTRVDDMHWRFTYHFTDEDYEYAREHGREY